MLAHVLATEGTGGKQTDRHPCPRGAATPGMGRLTGDQRSGSWDGWRRGRRKGLQLHIRGQRRPPYVGRSKVRTSFLPVNRHTELGEAHGARTSRRSSPPRSRPPQRQWELCPRPQPDGGKGGSRHPVPRTVLSHASLRSSPGSWLHDLPYPGRLTHQQLWSWLLISEVLALYFVDRAGH